MITGATIDADNVETACETCMADGSPLACLMCLKHFVKVRELVSPEQGDAAEIASTLSCNACEQGGPVQTCMVCLKLSGGLPGNDNVLQNSAQFSQ